MKISDCCGASPIGEVHEDKWEGKTTLSGMCSDCKEHCEFEEEGEEL